MTLILGIKCKDGFVMGADSKSLEIGIEPIRRLPVIKRLDCEKINKLSKHNCLIGVAGNEDYTNRILDKLEKEIDEEIRDIDGFSKKFSSVIREIHSEDFTDEYLRFKKSFESVEKDKNIINSMTQWVYNEINLNLGFELIFGFFDKDNNIFCLNKANSSNPFLTPIKKYWPIGSGHIFAKYILNHIWSSYTTVSIAINIAIYVIEQVKTISDDVRG